MALIKRRLLRRPRGRKNIGGGDLNLAEVPDSLSPSGVASPLPKGVGMSIHPEVLRLMRQYQMEIRPFWAEYLAELLKKNRTLDQPITKDTTGDAYEQFVEQTEPARRRWEQKVRELREQGIIE